LFAEIAVGFAADVLAGGRWGWVALEFALMAQYPGGAFLDEALDLFLRCADRGANGDLAIGFYRDTQGFTPAEDEVVGDGGGSVGDGVRRDRIASRRLMAHC